MSHPRPPGDAESSISESLAYKEFLAEREEILRHKWIESEKAGCDIGFDRALLDWITKHRATWQEHRRQLRQAHPEHHPS